MVIAMSGPQTWPCHACGNIGLSDGDDGFYYCLRCGARAEDIIETGVADEDFVDKGGETGHALYLASHSRRRNLATIKAEPLSQPLSDTPNPLFLWSSLTLEAEGTLKTQRQIKTEEYLDDGVGPSGPEDFGYSSAKGVAPGFDDYYNEIRMRYMMGMQLMIQFQCEALVREFNASPLICGLAGTLWLRFVAVTGVFDDDWADQTIQDSEIQTTEELEDLNPRAKHRAEPRNMYGKRAVMIWHRSLRKRIPLSCSLAVSFLACHMAREAILSTDIVRWSLEGKLPFFAAFVEIEKHIGRPSSACPIKSDVMFRPSQSLPLQKLETLAALIAQSIGLDLPPVNFYAIASRYLQKLCLPEEKILPHACRIYEWSMPPDLWLSTNEFRLPTRVCVMSILIVAIRILYNLHGFGEWEKSLSRGGSSPTLDRMEQLNLTGDLNSEDDVDRMSGSSCQNVDDLGTKSTRNPPEVRKSELDSAELLHKLGARYNEIADTYEHSKDLPTYLQYCKDVAFAGLEPTFENHEEERLIEEFWEFYQNEKDSEPAEVLEEERDYTCNQKRSRNERQGSQMSKDSKKMRNDGYVSSPSSDDATSCVNDSQYVWNGDHSSQSSEGDQASAETLKTEAIRRMKLDMEENRFYYIPPRVNVKRVDYLHYVRKKDEGAFTYVAHADYYILLRVCARVAQVDIRIMHIGVLNLERRLAWLENRIDHCLHLTPPNVSCEFCTDVSPEDAAPESLAFSDLNI